MRSGGRGREGTRGVWVWRDNGSWHGSEGKGREGLRCESGWKGRTGKGRKQGCERVGV